jgi:hypothetical protein
MRQYGYNSPPAAHAHLSTGIICFREEEMLQSDQLCRHELAHILDTTDRGQPDYDDHGEQWKTLLLSLGGSLNAYRYGNSRHSNPIRREWSNIIHGVPAQIGEDIYQLYKHLSNLIDLELGTANV